MRRNKFITLEGLDGAGKTTHLEWLAADLKGRGLEVCITREPGGTPTGEALRALLLHPQQSLHAETETLLMFAARREHLEKVILPALDAGEWVLCDRFTDATFAYQGGGSGVAWEKIAELESWVQRGFQPDLTLYFDIEPENARSRMTAVRQPDRFEQEREAFHRAVRAAYLRRAAEHPERIRVIDSNRSIPEIRLHLRGILQTLF